MGTADLSENDNIIDNCNWLFDINIICFGIMI